MKELLFVSHSSTQKTLTSIPIAIVTQSSFSLALYRSRFHSHSDSSLALIPTLILALILTTLQYVFPSYLQKYQRLSLKFQFLLHFQSLDLRLYQKFSWMEKDACKC